MSIIKSSDLINTKEFQRLRRIKQLGTSVIPSTGENTVASPIVLGSMNCSTHHRDFEEKYPDEWNPAESLLTMTAALPHDLGHGAYSHTFEHLFDTDHEAITRKSSKVLKRRFTKSATSGARFSRKGSQCHRPHPILTSRSCNLIS